jgi:hypothetical protein
MNIVVVVHAKESALCGKRVISRGLLRYFSKAARITAVPPTEFSTACSERQEVKRRHSEREGSRRLCVSGSLADNSVRFVRQVAAGLASHAFASTAGSDSDQGCALTAGTGV